MSDVELLLLDIVFVTLGMGNVTRRILRRLCSRRLLPMLYRKPLRFCKQVLGMFFVRFLLIRHSFNDLMPLRK